MDMLTMKIVPTADPTVFRGIFLAGINNMIDDNVTGIDPDTSQKMTWTICLALPT